MFRRLLARLRARPVPAHLTLYTRSGCGLCEEMKHELARARTAVPLELEEVDISRDPELEERYGLSIPVLAIEGRPAFKGRLTAREFEAKLARRLAERAPPPSTAPAAKRGSAR